MWLHLYTFCQLLVCLMYFRVIAFERGQGVEEIFPQAAQENVLALST